MAENLTDGMPNTVPRVSVRVAHDVCEWLQQNSIVAGLTPQVQLAIVDVVRAAIEKEL